jgi:hypothetical protein
MYPPETQARIEELTRKALNNTITLEEEREAIRLLRNDRRSAADASAKATRSKAKTAVIDGDALLAEIGL